MAVYLTKSMLSKMKSIKYRPTSVTPLMEDDGSYSYERWQKISAQGPCQLARDMICRVCAGSGCTPIVDRLTEDYDIITGLRSLTNIAVSLDDSLPKFICTECLETLKLAMAFKRNCEVTDRKFRQIMNPMGDPLLHTYPYSKTDFNVILQQMKEKRMEIEQRKEKYRQEMEKLKKKNHPKEKEIKCSTCDLTFSDKDKLASHRRERQCMRRACDICGQLVLSIAQHRRHIHKQSTPHKCPTCGKEFPILARLKTHMVVHSNTFNFYCDLCPYRCKHKYYLVMHMRTHTGEKPYKCAECPSTFMNPSNLNKHKLTHQDKQYKCMICEKAFRTTHALREHHEAAHMNIKHFCSYCGRGFCYKSDLRKHEIKTHNRVKRDYVGGEPTYKQVERLQNIKLQEAEPPEDDDKWRAQQPAPALALHTYAVEEGKEYIYFSEVGVHALMPPPQPQLVQQETVDMLPEMEVKKLEDVKLYATPQGMAYFQG